jgi:hypothetical protein
MIKKMTSLLFISVIPLSSSLAKIGDCDEIQDGEIFYRSHSNYVEAYKKSVNPDSEEDTILWHTELFTEQYKSEYNPNIEQDVQWNIACVEKLTPKGNILTTDGKNRKFYINKHTGRVVYKSK